MGNHGGGPLYTVNDGVSGQLMFGWVYHCLGSMTTDPARGRRAIGCGRSALWFGRRWTVTSRSCATPIRCATPLRSASDLSDTKPGEPRGFGGGCSVGWPGVSFRYSPAPYIRLVRDSADLWSPSLEPTGSVLSTLLALSIDFSTSSISIALSVQTT